MATQATFCGNIVVKLQNTNAYAVPCRISYTVCGSPPVILLKFNDYIIHNFRQPEKTYLTTAVATSTVTPKPIVLDTEMRLMY
ncbi:MAG: hypothetical protein J6U05_07495 [Neisseriaceae bacterium]|nr:hypothetical protein [Neisseriaceae bacterium]